MNEPAALHCIVYQWRLESMIKSFLSEKLFYVYSFLHRLGRWRMR